MSREGVGGHIYTGDFNTTNDSPASWGTVSGRALAGFTDAAHDRFSTSASNDNANNDREPLVETVLFLPPRLLVILPLSTKLITTKTFLAEIPFPLLFVL